MSGYRIDATEVADTFAEAFPMRYARVVITAATDAWALEAARSMTGFATSVIGCKCEAAIEQPLAAARRPTAGPGSPCCCSRWTARESASACSSASGRAS